MSHKLIDVVKRLFRFLPSSPFENLPTEFGDPVPADLREFEQEAEEAQHHPQGSVLERDRSRSEPTSPIRHG
jgi:hypothetical protein